MSALTVTSPTAGPTWAPTKPRLEKPLLGAVMWYWPVEASHVWAVEATRPSRRVQAGLAVSFRSEKSSKTWAFAGPPIRAATVQSADMTKYFMADSFGRCPVEIARRRAARCGGGCAGRYGVVNGSHFTV